MLEYMRTALAPYFVYFPYALAAFLSSFVLTPLIGFIATKLEIVDLPAKLRKPTDKTLKTRVKKYKVPRAGGLAVIIPFLVIVLTTQDLSKQVMAIIIGIIVLATIGILDDRFQVVACTQLVMQLIATLIVVAAGISIDSIQNPFGVAINLRLLELPFHIGSSLYSIALPADLITITWILVMMNAVNWIFGTDGLGEGIVSIAFVTIVLISVKSATPLSALLAAVAAGGILGFLPFNLPPSKILSGTTGTTIFGFMIAVLSILGGVKVSTSIIVLIIPLIDMIWVMVTRLNRHGVENMLEVLKVTTTGDDTHLHHRLLKLGFAPLHVALIEWLAVGICAVIAFSTASLSRVTIIAGIGVVVLIMFLIISILLRKGYTVNGNYEKAVPEAIQKKQKAGEHTPESRYAY